MIIPTWQNFRYVFAVKGSGLSGGATATFVPPNTINQAGGSWVAEGVLPGHLIDFAGTVSNNTRYTVATVAAGAITVLETVVAEGPLWCSFVSAFHDVDGLETWPIALVRAGGIGPITGVPRPYAGTTFTATINALANDAVPFADEYDWYLSQRTDVVASQLLTIAPFPVLLGQTKSGSVRIAHNGAFAEAQVGFGSGGGGATLTPDMIPVLFKYGHLYVQRRADQAIQWLDLLRAMTAAV